MKYSLEHDKIKKNKYVIINTGVDTSKFISDEKTKLELKSKFGFIMDDFILGNIGVLSIRKGQIYLLKAFNSLKEKYPALRL